MKNEVAKNSGFTLVELLVVISIIAILLAVLMPGLGKARRLAQRTVCLARVQQISMSAMTYSQSNNGKFPHQFADNKHKFIKYPLTTTKADEQDSWIKHIYPYIKRIEHFRCPSNNGTNGAGEDGHYPPKGIDDFSYTYNGVIAHFGGIGMKRTSQTIVFYDDPSRSCLSILRPFYCKDDAAKIRTGRYWTGWMRWADGSLHGQMHDNGSCYTFLDGHAKYMKLKDVTSLWFGLLISRDYIDGKEPEVRNYETESRGSVIKW